MQPKPEDPSTTETLGEEQLHSPQRPGRLPQPTPKPAPKPAPTTTDWVTYAELGVAILALFCFGLLIVYMLSRTPDATELEWQRDVYLLSGVEAVAFAAAGFLFGKEVHRQQAEQAAARADKAEEKSASAEQNAQFANRSAIEVRTRARALTAAINAKAEGYAQQAAFPQTQMPLPIESFGEPGVKIPFSAQSQPEAASQPPAPPSDLLELQRLARELFP